MDWRGTPPSLEERMHLQWPHSEWWSDRDRIVLLATYIEYMSNPFMSQAEPGGLAREPPNHLPELGTRAWELEVCDYAILLWSDGRKGTCDLRESVWLEPKTGYPC